MQATVKSLGIDQLSVAERIVLVQEIWDTIAEDATPNDMPDWHKEILDERIAAYEANPSAGATWEDVKANILNQAKGKSA